MTTYPDYASLAGYPRQGDRMAAPVRDATGRFLSKAERQALEATEAAYATTTNTNTERESNMSATETASIEFVDELPSIHRTRDGGVWVDRLEPLKDHQGQWAKVYGPTKNPHALVNNLRQGSAAGIDPSEYTFAGRMLPAGDDVPEDKQEDGKTGYVFARFDTPDQRAEREAKEAERAAAREAGEDVDEDDEV